MRSIRYALGVLVFVCFSGFAQPPATDYRVSDEQLDLLIEKLQRANIGLPNEARVLNEAWTAGDTAKVKKVAEGYIAKPIGSFPNPWYGARLKADAHYYLYKLSQFGNHSPVKAHQHLLAAVRGGHYPAAEEFMQALLMRDPALAEIAANPTKFSISEIATMGATLGGGFSSAALAVTPFGNNLSNDERTYWLLITIMRDKAKENAEKRELLGKVIAESGEAKIAETLSKFAIAGGPFSDDAALPGRSIYEALFADSDLRGQFGIAAGSLFEPGKIPKESMSIREQFDFYSRVVPSVGFGDVYLLYPKGAAPPSPRSVKMSTVNIMSQLRPSDRVFLSCGGIAHVAILSRADAANGTLLFIDPLFQYWQPSHNSCVSSFKLVRDRYERYLSAIPASDIAEMLVGVITIRRAK